MAEPPAGTGQRRHKKRAVGTVDIEGDLEALVAQSAQYLPLLAERAFGGVEFDGPRAFDVRR